MRASLPGYFDPSSGARTTPRHTARVPGRYPPGSGPHGGRVVSSDNGRPRCGATCRDGTPCRNWPRKGQARCRMHGGSSPQALAAADRRAVEAQARKLLADLDIEPINDPLEAFEAVVAEARAFQRILRRRLTDLEGWRYRTGSGTEQLRSEVALYERALDRVAKLLVQWQQLGLAERHVQIERRHAEALAEAVRAGIAAVGLDAHDQQTAVKAAASHLRAVEGA